MGVLYHTGLLSVRCMIINHSVYQARYIAATVDNI